MENPPITKSDDLEIVIIFSNDENIKNRQILAIFGAENQTAGTLDGRVIDAISLNEHQVEELIEVFQREKQRRLEKENDQFVKEQQAFHRGVGVGHNLRTIEL